MNPLKVVFAYINAPVYQCLMPEGLFELGIGHVVVARKSSGGRIGAGFFLVDVFCLGVKDTFFTVLSEDQFQATLQRVATNERLVPLQPACARNLIEGAVQYARNLGIAPNSDYKLTQKVLLNLDGGEKCSTNFQFGKDGQPLYVAGPNDSSARQRQILNLLTKKCGANGFHYILPVGGTDGSLGEGDFDTDLEES
jgi:hypothetical protein